MNYQAGTRNHHIPLIDRIAIGARQMNRPAFAGWIAVGLSTLFSCLWAFWGVFESFHEGWYFESPVQNLVLTGKYLILMAILMMLSRSGDRRSL